MPVKRDPADLERTNLHAAVDLTDARVLEIGCGEGRLTALYQDVTRQVIGIDVQLDMLQSAKNKLYSKSRFAIADALSLPFANKSFDVVIFAWSL